MLKAVQILGQSSSSWCVSLAHRFKKPHAVFSLISRTLIEESPRTHSWAHQFSKCCGHRAAQMARAHSAAIPADTSFYSSFSSSSTTIQSPIDFCPSCGGPTIYDIPNGDVKARAICMSCRKITYEFPKMVVGCLVEHENKILLSKRRVPPCIGLWMLPAGYLERGESAAAGAIDQTWEEANAEVEVLSPFALLDIPLISHIYTFFLAKMKSPRFSPGPESLECKFFELEDIPIDSLAFTSTLVTLRLYIEDRIAGSPKFHYASIDQWPGADFSEIHAYDLNLHLKS